jgi:hypothetical protein
MSAQNDETGDNIEILQAYPVVTADTLVEIGTAVISSVLLLDEHLTKTNICRVPKVFTSR